MVVRANARRLVGRQREQAVLARLLDAARDGRGGVLVVHGDPGARQDRAARLRPSRQAQTFGRCVLGRRGGNRARLRGAATALFAASSTSSSVCPAPARCARRRFRAGRGKAPSRSSSDLQFSGFSPKRPSERPLLCLVDDAQWLDGASAQRSRLWRPSLAERIVLAFSTREKGTAWPVSHSCQSVGLGPRDARALLESVLVARLDDSCAGAARRRDQAGIHLRFSSSQRADPRPARRRFQSPGGCRLRLGSSGASVRRLARLPRDARRLLLLAAAEPVGGNPALLLRAARQLGIPETAAQTVKSDGFLTFDGTASCVIPLCAQWCTARRIRTSDEKYIALWRTRPIRSSTRIDAHGIGHRRHPAR